MHLFVNNLVTDKELGVKFHTLPLENFQFDLFPDLFWIETRAIILEYIQYLKGNQHEFLNGVID